MSIIRDFEKGDFLHITNRGNRKQKIFYDDDDREYLRSLLFHLSERFSNKILSYCFMENHYHLLTKAYGKREISKMMQVFGQKSSYYFNQKYKTVGRLYQAPYWHNKIDSEIHLLLTSRYIHRNPLDLTGINSISEL
jgi:REP element-mobilizing transposase RayT